MLRVLIVDDEAPARKRLRKLLAHQVKDERIAIVGEAGDGIEALERLQENDVDLVFLDIRMPGLDGFDVLERLDPVKRPAVVFTTAYDAYAIRAFEASATDYLLKPIIKERLDQAIERVARLRHSPTAANGSDERFGKLLDWLDAQSEANRQTAHRDRDDFLKHLSIPYRDRILIIPIERLVSVEIVEGITRVYLVDEAEAGVKPRLRQHLINYTLDQLDARLDPDVFMRVHRSAIVQVGHIREMIPWFSGRFKLILSGGHEVIASRERSKLLKERLMI